MSQILDTLILCTVYVFQWTVQKSLTFQNKLGHFILTHYSPVLLSTLISVATKYSLKFVSMNRNFSYLISEIPCI